MNSIEEMTLVAIGQRLRKVFELDTQPIEMPTTDRIQLAYRRNQLAGQELSYPIVAYSLDDVGPGDTASPTSMLYRGVPTSIQGDTIGQLKVIPVTVNIGVTFLDNDRIRVLRTMSRWMFARGQGLLNFRLRVDDVPIDIQVTPTDTLSAPRKDINLEVANQYELEGSLSVRTYLTGEFDASIVRVTRLAQIVTEFNAPPADHMPADLTGRFNTAPTVDVNDKEVVNFNDEDTQKNLLFSITTTTPSGG